MTPKNGANSTLVIMSAISTFALALPEFSTLNTFVNSSGCSTSTETNKKVINV
jgi:hypothetical protein